MIDSCPLVGGYMPLFLSMRHLKNINELAFYAALSCGGSFISRLFPAFWVPILLLRIGIFAYCLWVLVLGENNRIVAGVIGSSLIIGAVGGYWDLIDVKLRFDASSITRNLTIIVCLMVALSGITLQVYLNGQAKQK